MIGQKAYKKELSLTIYTHMLRMHKPELNIPKMNLLVFGPSGTGKTSGVKLLVDNLGVRSGICNGERLTPEGIQGAKLTDPLTRALGKKHDNMVYVCDEFDKIFHNDEFDGMQHEFLSLLDEKNVITFPTTFGSFREYREIPSRNITCILCGKFEALGKTVEDRLGIHKVGFNTERQNGYTQDELYARVTMNDLRTVLNSDELCRRIGSIVGVSQLSEEELVSILVDTRDSAFCRYQAFFTAHGAKMKLTKDGAQLIVGRACSLYPDLGVSGLENVVRDLLKEEMMEADSLKGRSIVIDESYIRKRLEQET